MKKCCLIISLFLSSTVASTAQNKTKKSSLSRQQQAITFNSLGLAEPQAAVGLGFTKMFAPRSSYFTELSYIFKSPFYQEAYPVTGGYRWLLQYRYHNIKDNRRNHFWGAEFRMKGYGFTGTNTFINKVSNDTLITYPYKAQATSVGGAILLGTIFNLSRNNRWQMEITCGIGAKHKFVKYKNLQQGYKPTFPEGGWGLKPPEINEAVGMPYFPTTIRLRYCIL